MKENKFFTYIKNTNTLLAFLVGISIIFTMLYFFTIDPLGAVKDKVDPDLGQKELRFSNVVNIEDTPYSIMGIYNPQSKSSSYSANGVKNYIFIDSSTGYSNWLLPTNQYLILNYYLMYSSDKKPKFIIYEIVKEDSDKDGYLTSEDKKVLGISLLDGGEFKELMKNVDKYLGNKVLENDLVLFYEKNKQGYSLHVNLENFTATKEIELAKIKDK